MTDNYEVLYTENKMELKALTEKLSLITDNINEKMGELTKTMNQNFDRLDKKIDSVAESVEELKQDLPNTIDERIKNNSSFKAYNILKWIVTSVLGAAGVSILVKILTQHYGI